MSARLDINAAKVRGKLKSDRVGMFAAHEWKRLIDPYTPRDTGALMGRFGDVKITPFRITYNKPYASVDYYNDRGVTFKTAGTGRNPYATDHWDQKAAAAGQADKLIKSINAALRSGRI